MLGAMLQRGISFTAVLAAGEASGSEEHHASSWGREGLLHPTALPLGLAIGCCLGIVTALIAFF